ncbi:MAG: NAD(P)H-hydrate epimerase, partial [Pyrinomonadaceae bacterium]
MRKVLTAEQMREVDRLTTERYGIPSIELMENAASAVARVVTVKLGGLIKGRSILILSGKGNNGGDGAALARILWNDGADVSVFLFGKIAEIRGDARANFDLLIQIECEAGRSGGKSYKFCIHQNDENLLSKLTGILETREVDLIVDAMFGTGLTRELSGEYSRIVQKLKDHISKIVSIDLPSGLDADRGFPIGPHVTTAATVTFTAPKAANVLAPSSAFGGELYLADIGSPQKLIDEQASDLFVTEKSDARLWLENAKFTHDSYKNKRGHALLIAGSASYSGAAV